MEHGSGNGGYAHYSAQCQFFVWPRSSAHVALNPSECIVQIMAHSTGTQSLRIGRQTIDFQLNCLQLRLYPWRHTKCALMFCICNSWDRREWFFDCALSGSVLSGNCLMPKMIRTQHNMFIGPAGWNMDHGAKAPHI